MKKYQKVILRASVFFTVAVIAYICIFVAMGNAGVSVATEKGEMTVDSYGKLLRCVLTLFGFSCVYGASSLILSSKMPAVPARLIHVAVLYAASLAAGFIMAASGSDARGIILTALFITVAFSVVYAAAAALNSLIFGRRRKQ